VITLKKLIPSLIGYSMCKIFYRVFDSS